MAWLSLLLFTPYLVLLFRIWSGLRKIKPFRPGSSPGIFISVVVACRNEAKNLPMLLQCISSQNYNSAFFELIIVDDNSSDGTFSIADEFAGIRNKKVLKNPGSGKKAAIRKGIEASEGDLIVTTDADCTMGTSWLSSIASFYSEKKPAMIIGPVRLLESRSCFAWFPGIEFLSLQGITAGAALAGNPVMCNGANLSFRKDLYWRHSGNLHDELGTGDDIFLLHSVRKEAGAVIMWLESDGATVTTRSPGTLFSFLDQRSRWISKAPYYNDRFTIMLGFATFTAVAAETGLLLASLFFPAMWSVFAAAFILKSIPDLLILGNTSRRYDNKRIMRWFLPSAILYPFYVIAVQVFLVIKKLSGR